MAKSHDSGPGPETIRSELLPGHVMTGSRGLSKNQNHKLTMKRLNWLYAIFLAAYFALFPPSTLAVPGEETPCTLAGATLCEGASATLTAVLPPEYNPAFVEIESVEWTFLAEGSVTPVTLPNTTLSISVSQA